KTSGSNIKKNRLYATYKAYGKAQKANAHRFVGVGLFLVLQGAFGNIASVLWQVARIRLPLVILCLVAFAPCPHSVQNWFQAFPKVCQTVLHPRRHLRVYMAVDKALFFHIPKLGGQYLLRHAANGFL